MSLNLLLQSQSLVFYMDRENVLSRSITNILKKVLSRDVAITLTGSKPMKDKKIFRGTPLCKCIRGKKYLNNISIIFLII